MRWGRHWIFLMLCRMRWSGVVKAVLDSQPHLSSDQIPWTGYFRRL